MTVSTVRQWVDLLRRLTFHDSSGGQNHEANMIPSLPALHQHVLRAEYAIQSVYESREETSSFLSYTGSGWLIDEGGSISVLWDTRHDQSILINDSYRCTCQTGCSGSTGGCRSCFQQCRPCTTRCRCIGHCRNPHNRHGVCPGAYRGHWNWGG